MSEDTYNPEKLSKEEFILYSSPRYFRLVFSDLKPKTKNGDLVSAMNELIHSGIITKDSDWDDINLTKKGKNYKKIIKKFIKEEELHTPQSDGLFDYRSVIGRRCIIELISFLAKKFNFNDYFLSMKLPIFKNSQEKEWEDEWGDYFDEDKDEIDLSSESGQETLMEYLKDKRSFSERRKSKRIQKTLTKSDRLFSLNLTLIRKLLQEVGMNRPSPLIKHLVSLESGIFQKRGRNLKVDFSKLFHIYEILEDYIYDIQRDESLWLKEYFKLLKVPTSLFGFEMSNTLSYASKTDAFLSVAIEGPRIFASQFSAVRDLGELQLILFPINDEENMVISSRDLEMVFYFAIPIEKSNISINTNIIGLKNMPEIYRSSIKRFGKLLNRSETFQEVLHDYYEKRHKKKQDQRKDKLKELDNKVSKARMKKLLKIKKNEYKLKKKEWKEKEEEIEEFLDDLSHYSVSFFTTCQMITKKITHGFKINKCMAVYENGFVSIHYIISNDTLLTTITKGKPKYGKKLKKVIGQIRDSMEEILDIAHEEEIEYEDEDFF